MPDTATYKSPDELGITPEEHAGLIAVMEYLRGPQVVHAETGRIFGIYELADATTGRVAFNMSVPIRSAQSFEKYECGCAACIGGHLSLHLQGLSAPATQQIVISGDQVVEADDYVKYGRSRALHDLFYPYDLEGYWGRIKPATAADAISNFLASGNPDWSSAARRNGQDSLIEGDA